MVWVFALAVAALVVGALGLVKLVRAERRPAVTRPNTPPRRPPSYPAPKALLQAETDRVLAEVEAAMPWVLSQVELEAAQIREQTARELARVQWELAQDDDEDDGDDDEEPLRPIAASSRSADFTMPSRGRIWREDYVPADQEARYVRRGPDGRPALYLVDAGDRLAVWSPEDGGVLINPRGPGLRKIGLYSTSARGQRYASASAARGAVRTPGAIIRLRRDPTNEHDPHAVQMLGTRGRFAWVQRGRTPAVARHMDAGEDFAAVCLREGLFLVGARADLEHMLT